MTRTERTFYIVSAGYSLGGWFLGPIYPLFLLSRGLDLFQMNLVLGTYLIAVFLFEVPTGVVADYFGRKVSFLASCAVRAVAFALYAFADGFVDCVVAELIDAIGTTLASGALEAWAVDGVHAEGDRRPADRMFARSQVITRAAMVLGGIPGGYAASIDFMIPWLLGASFFATTGVLGAVLMYDDRGSSASRADSRSSLHSTLTAGLATVRASPPLMLICLLSFFMYCGGVPAHMLWQPHVKALTGEGVWLMGWIWALVNVFSLAGSAMLPRLLAHFRREQILTAVTLWRALMLVVAAAATGAPQVVIAVLLQEMFFGTTDPMMRAWSNEHATSAQRATVLSVASMFGTLGGSIGLVIIGLVARGYGIPSAWLCSAAFFAATAPGFLLLGRIAARAPLPEVVAPPALRPSP